MNITLGFSAMYLPILARFVATPNDARHYLWGIYAEPHPFGGVVLAATDGYTLVAIHDPEGRATSPQIRPISSGLLARAANLIPRWVAYSETDAYLYDDPDDWPCPPGSGYGALPVASPDRYPDWRRVLRGLSARGDTGPATYDSRLLDRLTGLGPVTLTITGPDTAALVRCYDYPTMLIAVQPMAVRMTRTGYPEWLRRQLDEAPQ